MGTDRQSGREIGETQQQHSGRAKRRRHIIDWIEWKKWHYPNESKPRAINQKKKKKKKQIEGQSH